MLSFYCYLILVVPFISVGNGEKCAGPDPESQSYFATKFASSPIVLYGKVVSANTTLNMVTFQSTCVLKGQELVHAVEMFPFTQLSDVQNASECHYLTAGKSYIVFVEVQNGVYKLANNEEIVLNNSASPSDMLEQYCDEGETNGQTTFTVFYANSNKCASFNTTCTEANRAALLAKTLSPLNKDTLILGSYAVGDAKTSNVVNSNASVLATLLTSPMPPVSTIMPIHGKAQGFDDQQKKNGVDRETDFSSFLLAFVGLVVCACYGF